MDARESMRGGLVDWAEASLCHWRRTLAAWRAGGEPPGEIYAKMRSDWFERSSGPGEE